MRSLEPLREAINTRYDRLTVTDAETMDHQVLLIRDWINAQPALRVALTEAERVEPDLDYDTWRENLADPEFIWPSRTEAGTAWLIWQLVNDITTTVGAGASYQIRNYSVRFRGSIGPLGARWGPVGGPLGVRDQNNNLVQKSVKQVFKPLFDYSAIRSAL